MAGDITLVMPKVAILSADPDSDVAFKLAETLHDDGIDIDFPTTGAIGKGLKKPPVLISSWRLFLVAMVKIRCNCVILRLAINLK